MNTAIPAVSRQNKHGIPDNSLETLTLPLPSSLDNCPVPKLASASFP